MLATKLRVTDLEKLLLYGLILSMATYAIPSIRIGSEEALIPIGAAFVPLMFLLVLIRSLITGKIASDKVLLCALFFMYLSIPLSSFFSVSIEIGRIIKLSIFMILPVLFTCIINDYKSLKIAIYSIIVVGLLLGIYGFYGYFTGNIGEIEQWWFNYARYWGIHYLPSTRNSDIYYIAIPFFIVLALVFFGKQKSFFIKTFMIISSLIFSIGILLSFSRGAWIATVITIIIFLFISFKRHGILRMRASKFWLLFIGSLLILIISYKALEYTGLHNYFIGKTISIIYPEKAALYLKETISNKERIDIIEATLKVIISYPLGVGPDNLKYYLGDYNLSGMHAENNYLQILAENGIVGFIGFMIFIFYPIIINVNRIKFGLYNWENIGVLLISIYLSISYLFNVEIYSFYIWIIHSIIWCNISLKANL